MSSLAELNTDGAYETGLELLELYAPTHPLLPQLRKGVSAINEMYLKQALKSTTVPRRPPSKSEDPGDNLRIQIGKLYKLKHKTRNRYHEVRTVLQRKQINRELIKLRSQIWDIQQQLDYFTRTGESITIPDLPPDIIKSNDLAELQAELYRVRPNVSKTKQKLRNAIDEGATKKRVTNLRVRLDYYTQKKEALEEKIKQIRSGQAPEV